MQLLQLGLVFGLHATQHVTDNHHERVELKHGIYQIYKKRGNFKDNDVFAATKGDKYKKSMYSMCLSVWYLIKVEVVVYTERHKMGQAFGGEVLFGDAQLLVGEGALIDS